MVAHSSTRRQRYFRLPLKYTSLTQRARKNTKLRKGRPQVQFGTALAHGPPPLQWILPARGQGCVEQDSQGSSDKVFPQTAHCPRHFLEKKEANIASLTLQQGRVFPPVPIRFSVRAPSIEHARGSNGAPPVVPNGTKERPPVGTHPTAAPRHSCAYSINFSAAGRKWTTKTLSKHQCCTNGKRSKHETSWYAHSSARRRRRR